MALYSLLIFATAAITALQGHVYKCSRAQQTVFTPIGSFRRSPDDNVTSCALRLPAGMHKDSPTFFIYVASLNSVDGDSCGIEYIQFFTGSRLCNNPREPSTEHQLANDTRAPLMTYSTQLSRPQMTFAVNFKISIDVCSTHDVLTSTSLLMHIPARRDTHQCTVIVNTTQVDLLIITSVESNHKKAECVNNDITLTSNTRVKICAGRFCLENTGVHVAQHDKVKVDVVATAGCILYWRMTLHSKTLTQDICSLTGRDLLLSEGKLASPGYRLGYGGPLNCTVVIKGFEAVVVTFKFYNLRQASCAHPLDGNSCNCGDRLLINGNAICGHFTGDRRKVYFGEVPLQLLTVHESLYNTEGFFVQYQGYSRAADICRMSSLNWTLPLVIKSPNFPGNYTNTESCTVTVDVSEIDIANLMLLHFDVEGDKDALNCPYDYLSIANSRYCGRRTGEFQELNLLGVASLQLHFKSDETTALGGFYISIQVKPSSLKTTTSEVTHAMSSSTTSSTAQASSTTLKTSIFNISLPVTTTSIEEKAADEVYTEQTLGYEVPGGDNNLTEVKLPADLRPTISVTAREGNISDQSTASEEMDCGVPWYYWVASLIAILLAILITMSVFLIKLRRLKEPECCHHVDTESSRDGLSNPAYYSQMTPHYNTHGIVGNPFYTNMDRMPPAKRVYINKNSTQTTV